MHSDNSVGSDNGFPDGVGSLELNGRAAGPGGGGSKSKINGNVSFYGKDSDHGLEPGSERSEARRAAVPSLDGLLLQGGGVPGGEAAGLAEGDAAGGPEGDAAGVQKAFKERVEVIGRKCACGSPWCPDCRRGLPAARMRAALERFDWSRVRHITLTVNPDAWEGPQAAFDALTGGKALPQFIRDLRRVLGVYVSDFWYVLEWHRSGFPHWHVLIEVDRPGRAGQIGKKEAERVWKYGLVWESFFKTDRQWKKWSGYIGKHGYLEKKKGHQAILPECFQQRKTGSIRKMNGSTKVSRAKWKIYSSGTAADSGSGDSLSDQKGLPCHTDRGEAQTDRQTDQPDYHGDPLGWISDDLLLKMDLALIKKWDDEHDTGGALMARYHVLMGWDDLEPEDTLVVPGISYEGAFELCGAMFDISIPTCQFKRDQAQSLGDLRVLRSLPVGFFSGHYYECRVYIPYEDFKSMTKDHEYIPGVGLSGWLGVDDLLYLLKHQEKQRTDIMIEKVG